MTDTVVCHRCGETIPTPSSTQEGPCPKCGVPVRLLTLEMGWSEAVSRLYRGLAEGRTLIAAEGETPDGVRSFQFAHADLSGRTSREVAPQLWSEVLPDQDWPVGSVGEVLAGMEGAAAINREGHPRLINTRTVEE